MTSSTSRSTSRTGARPASRRPGLASRPLAPSPTCARLAAHAPRLAAPLRSCNVGYAFINFLSPAHILAFYEEFNFRKWDRFNSDKVCEIAYGRIQGKAALLTHFANSSLVHEDECYRPVVFASDGSGRRESFVGMASGLR